MEDYILQPRYQEETKEITQANFKKVDEKK